MGSQNVLTFLFRFVDGRAPVIVDEADRIRAGLPSVRSQSLSNPLDVVLRLCKSTKLDAVTNIL